MTSFTPPDSPASPPPPPPPPHSRSHSKRRPSCCVPISRKNSTKNYFGNSSSPSSTIESSMSDLNSKQHLLKHPLKNIPQPKFDRIFLKRLWILIKILYQSDPISYHSSSKHMHQYSIKEQHKKSSPSYSALSRSSSSSTSNSNSCIHHNDNDTDTDHIPGDAMNDMNQTQTNRSFFKRLKTSISCRSLWFSENSVFAAYLLLIFFSSLYEISAYYTGLIPSEFYSVLNGKNISGFKSLLLKSFGILMAVSFTKGLASWAGGIFALRARGKWTRYVQELYVRHGILYPITIVSSSFHSNQHHHQQQQHQYHDYSHYDFHGDNDDYRYSIHHDDDNDDDNNESEEEPLDAFQENDQNHVSNRLSIHSDHSSTKSNRELTSIPSNAHNSGPTIVITSSHQHQYPYLNSDNDHANGNIKTNLSFKNDFSSLTKPKSKLEFSSTSFFSSSSSSSSSLPSILQLCKKYHVDNPDQRITQDIDRLCEALKEMLVSMVLTPILVLWYSYQTYLVGGPFVLIYYLYFILSVMIVKFLLAPLIKVIVQRERKEGDFRLAHTNLRVYGEEISILSGELREKSYLDLLLTSLLLSQKSVLNRQLIIDGFTNFISYTGSILSYMIIAIPVFSGVYDHGSSGDISKAISANAFASLYLVYKLTSITEWGGKWGEIAGYTSRIAGLCELCHDLDDLDDFKMKMYYESKQTCQKTELRNGNNNTDGNDNTKDDMKDNDNDDDQNGIEKHVVDILDDSNDIDTSISHPSHENEHDLLIPQHSSSPLLSSFTTSPSSSIKPNPLLILSQVTLNTPTSIPIVKSLNLTIYSNTITLICGSSGVGKSSLLRCIAGLWTPESGSITNLIQSNSNSITNPNININSISSSSPFISLDHVSFNSMRTIIPPSDMLFLPQTPYFCVGSIRDQITYPLHPSDTVLLDDHITELLNLVGFPPSTIARLKSLPSTTSNWNDILSCGEKQRLQITRILFHRPKCILLDEFINSLDEDSKKMIWNTLCDYLLYKKSLHHHKNSHDDDNHGDNNRNKNHIEENRYDHQSNLNCRNNDGSAIIVVSHDHYQYEGIVDWDQVLTLEGMGNWTIQSKT